jgi:hypothetical protein
MNVIARTRAAPLTLATTLRRGIQAIDADLPIGGPFTLAERLGDADARPPSAA